MRIVAGDLKGFQLVAPKTPDTRPTSDKVREAIFSILGDSIVDARVLDLYAGSGAMGLEALSRGAAHADLVEMGAIACGAIQQNVAHTKLSDRVRLWRMRVIPALAKLKGPFDIVFLDPPYEAAEIGSVMERLGSGPFLAQGSTVVLEHSKRYESSSSGSTLVRLQIRRYGDTSVSFYGIRDGDRVPDNSQAR